MDATEESEAVMNWRDGDGPATKPCISVSMADSMCTSSTSSSEESLRLALEAYKEWLMTKLKEIGCCCGLLMGDAPLKLKSLWIDNRLHSEACPVAVREMVRWSRWKA